MKVITKYSINKYIRLLKKTDLSLLAVIFCIIVVFTLDMRYKNWQQQKTVLFHDVLSYYAYLPSAFVYHDMELNFLKSGGDKLGKHFWGKSTSEHKVVIITSYGMSLLYSPFFGLAHIYAGITGYPQDGLSTPYLIALVFSSLAYLILGLFALRKLLLMFFSQTVTAITIVGVVISTNLLWYVAFESAMSHTYSFALITTSILVYDKWIKSPKIYLTIVLGLLIGIISIVRPTNIIIVVLFFFWRTISPEDIKKRFITIIKRWPHLILIAIMATIIWIPQFMYWKYLTGSYLYYSYPDDQGFFFNNPQLLNIMFSWRKGFIIYTPLMAFSILGIILLYKQKRELFLSVIIYFLLTWYILSSWWDWWYGGGFSIRPLIDSYGIMSLGIASFLTWVLKVRVKFAKGVLILLFISSLVLGFWNYKRYYGGSIHWVAMTKEAFLDNFWSAKPKSGFYDKLRAPDYELARKGIYKYKDESEENK